MWEFDWKTDEYGWRTLTKPRMVARGNEQRANIDFGDLFAPTVAVSGVRLLAAMACELNLGVCHFTIEQAFVQSDLQDLIFMRLLQGFGRWSETIMRLNKSIYGLKQASRQWHTHFTRCLQASGFLQCLFDACVFRLMEQGGIAWCM